jgi:hypothetical protein
MEAQYESSSEFRQLCPECITHTCEGCHGCHFEAGINKRDLLFTQEMGNEDATVPFNSVLVVSVSEVIPGWITAQLAKAMDGAVINPSPYGDGSAVSVKITPEMSDSCTAALANTATPDQWQEVYDFILNSPACKALG